jgi:hypothetical protein
MDSLLMNKRLRRALRVIIAQSGQSADDLLTLTPYTASMSQDFHSPLYQSFVLRLWCDSPTSGWRASLEDIATGQRQSFASLDLLATYLLERAMTPPLAKTDMVGDEQESSLTPSTLSSFQKELTS